MESTTVAVPFSIPTGFAARIPHSWVNFVAEAITPEVGLGPTRFFLWVVLFYPIAATVAVTTVVPLGTGIAWFYITSAPLPGKRASHEGGYDDSSFNELDHG